MSIIVPSYNENVSTKVLFSIYSRRFEYGQCISDVHECHLVHNPIERKKERKKERKQI